MKRTAKKIAYGFGFGICALGILWGVFQGTVAPNPSCSDGKKNQDETEIDCGGSCVPCAIAHLEPIRGNIVGTFNAGSEVVLLGEIINPNSGFGSSDVKYEFVIHGLDGSILERVAGSEPLASNERRYVYAAGIKTSAASLGNVEVLISPPNWIQSLGNRDSSGVLLSGIPKTDVLNNVVSVDGTIRNQSPLPQKSARIIVILRDSLGGMIFAGETITEDLGGLESRPFRVLFPKAESISSRVDPARTDVFVY